MSVLSGRRRIPVEGGVPLAAHRQADPGPQEYHCRFRSLRQARRFHDRQNQNRQVYRSGREVDFAPTNWDHGYARMTT
jgi:hypothetical protein